MITAPPTASRACFSSVLAELDGQIEAARAAEDACWSGAEFNEMRWGFAAHIPVYAVTFESSLQPLSDTVCCLFSFMKAAI